MPVSRAEAVALFPTGGAIPEELQIGRSAVIDDLTAAATGGSTLIFAEARRLGKSSLLLAMTDRILRDAKDRIALSVDLRDGVANSGVLASTLLTQANKQGAGAAVKAMATKNKLSQLAPAALNKLRAAGKVLGEADDAAALGALGALLSPSGATLRGAMLALEAHGHATGQRTIIVLDEAQDLVRWDDALEVQQEIATTVKRPRSTVNFVFSGSETHTLLALYEDRQGPLHGLGMRFPLPEISRDDWSAGLRQRFDTAGIPVDAEQLHQILYYSDGHPLRTMLICVHALDWLEDERITAETISRAIASAERHPSWSMT